MRTTQCIYLSLTAITSSVYCQSKDDSDGEKWAGLIIIGVLSIIIVLALADAVHKKFLKSHAALMADLYPKETKRAQSKYDIKSWAQQPRLQTTAKPQKAIAKAPSKPIDDEKVEEEQPPINNNKSKPKSEPDKVQNNVIDTIEKVITKTDDKDDNKQQNEDNKQQKEDNKQKDDDIEVVIREDDKEVVMKEEYNDPEVIIHEDADNDSKDDGIEVKYKEEDVEIKKEEEYNDPEVIIHKDKEVVTAAPVTGPPGGATPIKETLEKAWIMSEPPPESSSDSDSDSSGDSEEEGDVMGDLASVRVEIDKRVLNQLPHINEMETPQSTAL